MSDSKMMRVQKRNGSSEEVSFDKVLNRIRKISDNLNVNIFDIAQKVCSRIFDLVKTSELDELAAHICSSMITEHPDYGTLGARIIVSNHHKNTSPSFSETVNIMYNNVDVHGEKNPLVSEELYEVVMANKEKLNSCLDYQRDYLFDYFGFKTLERSYLMKVNNVVVERPQHMFMRVAIGIHGEDVKEALQTYELMSSKYFTHATPTLFNSGTPRPQLSSCFLLHMEDDSIDGVFSTLKECAMISKYSGGIGLHIHNVRAKGSRIRGTNGYSDGIMPMMRVYNNTARYVNQCFTPDTVVYSADGPKRMDEVQIGDQLVTIDGSFKNVNTVSVNNVDKEILEIRTKYAFESIKVTPEHEMYVIAGQRKMTNYDVIKNRLKLGIVKPEFKLAKDLEEDDMVGYPIPSYERDFGFDADFCRLYGIMIGDGSIYKRSANSLEYKAHLNNTTKVKTAMFVEQYLASRGIHYWVTKETDKDTYTIGWSTQTCGIAYDDLYDNEKVKHIAPKFMHLPADKTRALIRGLMETDGHVGKELYFHSTSYQVAHAFRYMLLRLGSLCSGHMKDEVGKGHYITRSNGKRTFIETKKVMYVVRVPKSEVTQQILEDIETEFNGFFTHNGIIWSRIRSIDTAHYTGDVYDFNMMDNHNYTVASFGLVHNSGKRNGSIAMYLEPWHADVEAFLEMKKNHGSEEERARDLFYALWIPDLFMHRVKEAGVWSLMCPDECPGLSDVYGEEFTRLYEKYEAEGRYKKQIKAQDLWWQILQMQIEQGVPYLLFKDAANNKSNQKNLGTIKSSNLCVAPETMVLTKDGYYPIVDLAGQNVEVWNGKQFSGTTVHQTGRMQKLLTVKFSNGMEVRCTPYHKFYIEMGTEPTKSSDVKIVEAKDLTVGMRIIRYVTPCLNTSNEEMKYAYTHGLFCADGTYIKHDESDKHQCNFQKWNDTDFCKRHQQFEKMYDDEVKCCAQSLCDKPILYLYGEKKNLLEHVDFLYHNDDTTQDRVNVAIPHDITEKFYVPLNASIASKIAWLSGYLDGDGCTVRNGKATSIQVSSINKSFLTKVVYLLQTLGVAAHLAKSKDEGESLLSDGKGGKRSYKTQPLYRICIDATSVFTLSKMGMKTYRLDTSNLTQPSQNYKRFVTIRSIVDNDEYDDTYCFNEPLEHKGIFNGVLIGNCSEVVQYTSPEETAVCNLASIALPAYIDYDENDKPTYNFAKLHDVVKVITKNLNKVIDVNFYPVEKARRSNLKHRPIGIGVQGLADAYIRMRYPFDSQEAMKLNKYIFETIYHASMEASMEISKKRAEWIGKYSREEISYDELDEKINLNEYEIINAKYPGAYSSFEGSPTSRGEFQFDLWGVTPESGMYDWDKLKEDVKTHGIRNSLLLAPMPTASTSQILGNTEAFEAITSNLYKRKTLAGEFIIVNKYLIADLVKLGLWDKDMKNKVIINDGSIQAIDEIPDELKRLYKTSWELKQKVLIDQSADRGAYVCQSQSLNLFVEDPDFKKLSSMHFYSWQKGLKTGIYYLRTRAKAQAQKFTIDPTMVKLTNLKMGGSNSTLPSASNAVGAPKAPMKVVCDGDTCEYCSG